MKKIIVVLCMIGCFASFSQSQPFNPNGDKPLPHTQFRLADDDVVDSLNVALSHPDQMKKLLGDYREITSVTLNIEPSQNPNFSDKEVFIFYASNCSGMAGKCFSKASLTIKRFFNKNIMDDTPWEYEVGKVSIETNQ